MPIMYQHRIYRIDLKNNPDVKYIFGDNTIRKGYGGQAKEMRDEPNAIGVATKWSPSDLVIAFFDDADYDEIVEVIDNDLEPVEDHLRKGGIVIIPSDGIGTGLSALSEHAPLVNAYLEGRLKSLENITNRDR